VFVSAANSIIVYQGRSAIVRAVSRQIVESLPLSLVATLLSLTQCNSLHTIIAIIIRDCSSSILTLRMLCGMAIMISIRVNYLLAVGLYKCNKKI